MRQSTAQVAPRPETPRTDVWELQRQVRRSGLSYGAQALLMAILDHDRYGQSRHGCTASLKTLAADIGATPQYVSMLLPELLKGGWIVAEARQGNVRPLRMKSPTNLGNHVQSTQESLGPVPKDRCVQSPRTIGTKVLGNEKEEDTAAPALPPVRGSVASEGVPLLDDGREIPEGLGVVGGLTLLEMVKLRGVPDADLIRAGHLRRARTSRPAN